MGSFLLLAIRILRCKSCQSATCTSVRSTASRCSKPSAQNASYDSSRCAASSAWISSLSAMSRARPERRWRTSSCQLGISHLGEPLQRTEKFCPFAPERRQLLPPCWGQPVAALAPPVVTRFPRPANPPSLLHAIEHGIKRRERKPQRSFGFLLDAPCHFIAMHRPAFENAQYRKFRRAALDSRPDHRRSPLHIRLLYIAPELVNSPVAQLCRDRSDAGGETLGHNSAQASSAQIAR